MFNSDTEMLFPIRAIPALGDLRGNEWQDLIQKISENQEGEIERISFAYMVVKLAGCSSCNADSFRAMRGCTQCSRLCIKRFKGSDTDLINHFQECQKDVISFMNKRNTG